MTAGQRDIITKGAVIGVVGFGAYYLYTVLLRQTGQITSTSNVPAPNALINPSAPQNAADLQKLTSAATAIYNALHYFWSDDWGTIWKTFQTLKTQEDVAAVAAIFSGQYNTDFWSYLQDGGGLWILGDGLSDTHLNQLHSYVNSLPSINPNAASKDAAAAEKKAAANPANKADQKKAAALKKAAGKDKKDAQNNSLNWSQLVNPSKALNDAANSNLLPFSLNGIKYSPTNR